jgi:hypothetical protein
MGAEMMVNVLKSDGIPRALVVACIALLAAPTARADTSLRWKFQKGQKLTYVMTQKSSSKTEVGGNSINQQQDQIIDMTWEVKDVDAQGNASMTQTIDRMRLKVTGPQPGMVSDLDTKSDQAPEGPMAAVYPLLQSMVGSPFELTMSPRGSISNVKVPAKIIERLRTLPGPMTNMFSEDSLKRMTTQATVVLPEKPVAAGAGWSDAKRLDMPFGTMVLDTNYKLAGEGGSDATIGMLIKVAIEPKDNAPFEVKLTDQDGKGKATFDVTAGLMKASEADMKMTMQISVNGQGLTTQVTTHTSLERVKASSGR